MQVIESLPAVEPVKSTPVTIRLTGTAPLILHRFGTLTGCCLAKGIRPWEQDVREAFMDRLPLLPGAAAPAEVLEPGETWPYRENTFGVSSAVLRKVCVDGAKWVKNATKVKTSGLVHVAASEDRMCPLVYSRVEVFESDHKIRKHAFKVWRPMFYDWTIQVKLDVMAGDVSPGTVVDLFNAAGETVGLGDFRPQIKGNPYGLFTAEHVED
jgi:hypothetical protein